MATVRLTGCTSQPMAGYLKALAAFRLVSEQIDPNAKGYWDPVCFCLTSNLGRAEIVDFFSNPIAQPRSWRRGTRVADFMKVTARKGSLQYCRATR